MKMTARVLGLGVLIACGSAVQLAEATTIPIMGVGNAGMIFCDGAAPQVGGGQVYALAADSCNDGSSLHCQVADPTDVRQMFQLRNFSSACAAGQPCTLQSIVPIGCANQRNALMEMCLMSDVSHYQVTSNLSSCAGEAFLIGWDSIFGLDASNNALGYVTQAPIVVHSPVNGTVMIYNFQDNQQHNVQVWSFAGFHSALVDAVDSFGAAQTFYGAHNPRSVNVEEIAGTDNCYAQVSNNWPRVPGCTWGLPTSGWDARLDSLLAYDSIGRDFPPYSGPDGVIPGGTSWTWGNKLAIPGTSTYVDVNGMTVNMKGCSSDGSECAVLRVTNPGARCPNSCVSTQWMVGRPDGPGLGAIPGPSLVSAGPNGVVWSTNGGQMHFPVYAPNN